MPFDQQVFEKIEKIMEESSKIYFDTTLNFLKWNTAISIGAVFWLGTYVISSKDVLDPIQKQSLLLSLGFFIFSVLISVGIFYGISKHFKNCWVLNVRWRQSYLVGSSSCPAEAEITEVNQVISDLAEHIKKLPRKATIFDWLVSFQLLLQFLGMCLFLKFIILIKQLI
jgi:hypothetical protein